MATATSGSLFTGFSQLYHRDLDAYHQACIEALSDLGVSREALTVRLYEIVEKLVLQAAITDLSDPSILRLLESLHRTELYLAMAAARRNAHGVGVVSRTYTPLLLDLCGHYCREPAKARHLARLVFGPALGPCAIQADSELYIQSYDGRATLSSWFMALLACRIARSRECARDTGTDGTDAGRLVPLPQPAPVPPEALDSDVLVSLGARDRLAAVLVEVKGLPLKSVARFFMMKASALRDRLASTVEALQEAALLCSNLRRGREDHAVEDAIAPAASEASRMLLPRGRHPSHASCISPNALAACAEGRLDPAEQEHCEGQALSCATCLGRTAEMVRLVEFVTGAHHGESFPLKAFRRALKTVFQHVG